MPSRYWPTALGLLAAAVLGWYLVYSQLLLRELQRDALVHYQLYSEIFSALNDPSEEAANDVIRLHSGGCPGEHAVLPRPAFGRSASAEQEAGDINR